MLFSAILDLKVTKIIINATVARLLIVHIYYSGSTTFLFFKDYNDN